MARCHRDGRWLAYDSNESGEAEVYLAPFPDVTASKRKVSTGGGTRPLWSKDGHELFYYLLPDTIMAVPVRFGTDVVLGTPQVVVKGPYAVPINAGRHYDVSPDGKRFLLLKDAESAAGAKPVPSEIILVQHWAEELEGETPGREVAALRPASVIGGRMTLAWSWSPRGLPTVRPTRSGCFEWGL